MLDGTIEQPAEYRNAAGVIYDEAGRMHRLVVELLDLARMDSGNPEFRRAPVDLPQLLERVVEKFTPQASEGQVELRTHLNPLPRILGDGDRLAQVFTNLIDNAVKHTPPGGVVSVETNLKGEQVEISVTDSGEGIPPEEAARIFERFYQLDKSRVRASGKGVGLGLAIANEIIIAHGGEISIHNATGQGSIFMVKIPVVQSENREI
jgi:two-component system sensor histidine kinase ResE